MGDCAELPLSKLVGICRSNVKSEHTSAELSHSLQQRKQSTRNTRIPAENACRHMLCDEQRRQHLHRVFRRVPPDTGTQAGWCCYRACHAPAASNPEALSIGDIQQSEPAAEQLILQQIRHRMALDSLPRERPARSEFFLCYSGERMRRRHGPHGQASLQAVES